MVTEDDKKTDLMRLRFPDIVKTMTVLLAVLLSAAGCSRSGAGDGRQLRRPSAMDSLMSVPGDSTVYALAAAGSSDSVLVFLRLPYHGEDPDTIDVLGALQRRQVFGRAEVGDNVAILPGQGDSARCVIVTEKLAGRWCYEVSPILRRKMGDGPLPERLQKLLEEKREYGMTMKLSGEVYTMGAYPRQADERTPVVWPHAKNYGRWALYNGRLVLSEVKRDTAGVATVIGTDTADFVRLRRDTLVLRFSDGERKYYRKGEEEQGKNNQ